MDEEVNRGSPRFQPRHDLPVRGRRDTDASQENERREDACEQLGPGTQTWSGEDDGPVERCMDQDGQQQPPPAVTCEGLENDERKSDLRRRQAQR